MFPLTPALSLKGEGVVRAGIILWGFLSPQGEGENTKHGNLVAVLLLLSNEIKFVLLVTLLLECFKTQ
ncbi:hypothetical protein AWI22_04835 [Enterobacter bugandensis]|nr:hypothetical protein AWI22_04835 [Enterobacter bugandensis]